MIGDVKPLTAGAEEPDAKLLNSLFSKQYTCDNILLKDNKPSHFNATIRGSKVSSSKRRPGTHSSIKLRGCGLTRSFRDMDRMASEKGPKKLVVLAPEDEEFMLTVKKSAEAGYTAPILIGDREKMERLADRLHYDIGATEKIYERNRQAIADLGIAMLFSGKVDGIVITGGLAHSKVLIEWVSRRTEFIAPMLIFPGEDEMEAMAEGSLRILHGEDTPWAYQP